MFRNAIHNVPQFPQRRLQCVQPAVHKVKLFIFTEAERHTAAASNTAFLTFFLKTDYQLII